jgi:hypothetical protein
MSPWLLCADEMGAVGEAAVTLGGFSTRGAHRKRNKKRLNHDDTKNTKKDWSNIISSLSSCPSCLRGT